MELRETKAACPYCGTGCGVVVQARGERIIGVRGDPQHPANFGKLCPKGQTLHLTATEAVLGNARLLYPQLRASRDALRARVTWDAALEHERAVNATGAESVAGMAAELGVRFDITPRQALTLELARHVNRDSTGYNEAAVQWSTVLP